MAAVDNRLTDLNIKATEDHQQQTCAWKKVGYRYVLSTTMYKNTQTNKRQVGLALESQAGLMQKRGC